jgi:hypothetical protein
LIKELILPNLGEGIEGAEVSEISVSIGDKVSLDDTVLVLESDKASMEIPAENEGKTSRNKDKPKINRAPSYCPKANNRIRATTFWLRDNKQCFCLSWSEASFKRAWNQSSSN